MTSTAIQRPRPPHALDWPVSVRVVLALAMVVAVEVIHLILTHVGPLPGDRWAAYHYTPWQLVYQSHWLRALGHLLTLFGTAGAAGLVCVIAIWRLVLHRHWDELVGLAIAYSAVLANALLKAIYGPTPLWTETGRWVSNFPSGHTTYATAVFGYLALLAYRHRRYWALWLALGVVVLMGPTRVTSGSHLPSDVLAGYLLGGAWLLLASAWLARRDEHRDGHGDRHQDGRHQQALADS